MQAAVERVIRSFSRKHPMQDAATAMHDEGMQGHATQMAAQLLENYRDHLADRSRKTDSSQQG